MKHIFYEKKYRRLMAQAAFLILIVVTLWILGSNAARNLQSQGVASGFKFLSETAGFSIIQTLTSYSESSTYFDAFIAGLLNTLLVSVIGIILATLLGFTIGLARLSDNYLVAKVSGAYVEIVRNMPLLLQLFFWYFVVLRSLPSPRQSIKLFDMVAINNRGIYVPELVQGPASFHYIALAIIFLIGALIYRSYARRLSESSGRKLPVGRDLALVFIIAFSGLYLWLGEPFGLGIPTLKGFNYTGGLTLIPEFVALLVALVIYTAAFIGEIVRAGILAVPKGQVEAAEALGLKRSVVLNKIVIPQALRVIIPPLTSQYLNLTKNSSLAAAVGYPELVSVFAGTVLNQTGQAVEVIFLTMSVYMSISLSIALVMNLYNKRISITER